MARKRDGPVFDQLDRLGEHEEWVDYRKGEKDRRVNLRRKGQQKVVVPLDEMFPDEDA